MLLGLARAKRPRAHSDFCGSLFFDPWPQANWVQILFIKLTLIAEVWWHLPLLALAVGGLAAACGLVFSCRQARKKRKIDRILDNVFEQLWDARASTV